ncbi:alkaline phosphatase PhoX [Actinoplanes sp. NPDC051475]|uniref:alkaline phosphatase PhoX n=1 Tax=Actinoplanes sp. NPDC051475 TaxID=3157225 RepID=UPI00344BD18B
MRRRALLTALVATAGGAAFAGSLWQGATGVTSPATPGSGSKLNLPDNHGLALPSGFTSRVIARSRQLVGDTGYKWHDAPDGGACFDTHDGWIYVSNSEVARTGGASAIRFRSDGSIASAYRILHGTNRNCAGGATPWGTWLSGEEVPSGYIYETDPYGRRRGVRRPAMGRFMHEAAACDPHRQVIYLTEDKVDGCFYRFRPDRWGDLRTGVLEVLVGPPGTSGPVSWVRVPQPATGHIETRYQVAGAKRFSGGEGCYYADGTCWFTTKHDNRVWAYDAVGQRIGLSYDGSGAGRTGLINGVDNITGDQSRHIYVAEDRGNMEINMIAPTGEVTTVVRIYGQDQSEITGPAFSPDQRRLYFSSQRGTAGNAESGITYEIAGPFDL